MIGGKIKLVGEYNENKVGELSSVTCKPYHIKEGAMLLGDVAHAVVPFLDQGLNVGFEDCLLFEEQLEKHKGELQEAAKMFTKKCHKDLCAIRDYSM